MVDFASATNEAGFVESVRDIFKSYVPESDAWAEPNFFSVNSTIIGGLMWTAFNEARNGFDARVNPQTATGEYLDQIAASPPLYLIRLGAQKASGLVDVNFPAATVIPIGYEFQSAGGVKYQATETVTLVSGIGTIPVSSVGVGSDQNSLIGQTLTSADGDALSQGVFGGADAECDRQLRQRIYAERRKACFFGSPQSYIDVMLGIPGVTRAWVVQDGFTVKIQFLMEDKYCCGVPLDADIDAITAQFADDCLTSLCICPIFEPAKSLVISPDICWTECPPETEVVETALQGFLRANYDIGEGVEICDLQGFLRDTFPEYGPSIKCCDDYPADPCGVYNCVELIGD